MSRNRQAQTISPKQIQLIHVAKSKLGLTDADYRTMLANYGVRSSKDLSFAQASLLIDELKEKGFELKVKGRPKNMPPFGRYGKVSRDRQLKKIEALLTTGNKPWAYADALARAICRNDDGTPIERLAWVPDDQLYKIITALRKQAQRDDWDLSGE